MNKKKAQMPIIRWILIIGVLLFSIAPILFVFLSSFKIPNEIFEFPPRLFFKPTLKNYIDLHSYFPEFFVSIKNSLYVTILTILLTLLVSVPAAYVYSRYKSNKLINLSSFNLLVTRMFPPIVVSIPLFTAFNVLNINDTPYVLIILYSTFLVSLTTLIIKAFIDGIPVELEEAARIDGATRSQVIWKIIFPLSAHGVIASSVFIIVFSWNEFTFAYILAGCRTRTAPVMINEMLGAVMGVQWGMLLAATTIQFIPILFFVFLFQRYLMMGINIGGVKG